MQLRGDVLPGKNNVPMRLEMSFTTGRASFRPSGPLQQPDDGRRGKPSRGGGGAQERLRRPACVCTQREGGRFSSPGAN